MFTDNFTRKQFDIVFHLALQSLRKHKPGQIHLMIDSDLKFGCHVLDAMMAVDCERTLISESFDSFVKMKSTPR